MLQKKLTVFMKVFSLTFSRKFEIIPFEFERGILFFMKILDSIDGNKIHHSCMNEVLSIFRMDSVLFFSATMPYNSKRSVDIECLKFFIGQKQRFTGLLYHICSHFFSVLFLRITRNVLVWYPLYVRCK